MGTHGGARPGAGRKSKRVKFPAQVDALDTKMAGHLGKATRNLIKLADGGYKRVTEVWKPAGLVQIARTVQVEGMHGPKILRHMEPAFPDLDPETLVCIERKVEVADPDREANKYLIDRIAGRPSTSEDEDESTKVPLEVTEEARKRAMERNKKWRQLSQSELASIRNPLTGEATLDSESTSDLNTSPDSSMMDEF